jgi:predicted amino acid racemase
LSKRNHAYSRQTDTAESIQTINEAKFNIEIWVSGGTSVAIPLILKNARPMAVNHFRIGSIIFCKDLFTGETFKGMMM